MLLVAGALLTACSASGAGGGAEHVRRPGLSATPDRKVTATNDSVAGYTTDAVLRQLTSDQDVTADVRGADSVAIEVGANDVATAQGLTDHVNHPNAAGHQQIATATVDVIESTMHS